MLDPQSNLTFAELYMLDERKFANESAKALLFSNRTSKRLRQAGIITIMDLLRMTPAMMLKIEGFGIGCLEEIERNLAALNDRQPVERAFRPTLPPQAIPEVSLPEFRELTLGEKYGMRPEDYVEVEVLSIPFSVRVSNVLMRSNITTIALLLEMTEEQLRSLRSFGRTCTEEIDVRLVALREEKRPKARKFTPEEHRLMAGGKFSFLVEEDLADSDNDFVARCIEAQEALGEELAVACLDEPEKIIPILNMVREFGQRITWQQELQTTLEEVPAHRRNNQAVAYINTFTRQENEREILLGLYPTPDAPLNAIVNSDTMDVFSFSLANRFLTWCRYDLKKEISHLFSILYPNERNWQVVQQRAQKKTLDHIGRQYGLTRERIRQLENKMQRAFNARQGRIKIISKINADKNNTALVTPADVAEYCTENLQELLFLLRGCESSNFTYDKALDVFIIGSDSLHERAFAFVEKLPDIIPVNDVSKFYEEAKEEYDLPQEMVDKAISETYKLTGEVYHRVTLSLANIYTEIIKEHYPDGIDAYNSDTIARVRQLIFDKYGAVKLPESDRALTARIAGICILCGRGRYRLKQKQYIPPKLAQRICDYIEDSDMEIFMTNTLFAVFEEDLRKHGVDNKYYLQGILHELFGDRFTFTRDYISKDPSITSIYSSIINFIRDAVYPVGREQILEQFPGLPDIAINIATSDPEILNFFGDYYHVESIVLSNEEKNYLNTVTKRVIADGGIHHASEIYDIVNTEKPELFTRNYAMFPFSAFSILESLFRDQYQFSRPFVAKSGVDITRPAERLHDFVYSKECLAVSDLSAFIREARLNVQSILELIDECNDEFLLTDAETIQRIEKTGINATVAGMLECAILAEITQTTPIRDLQCWESLPTIQISWTEWLVYSVLRKWGKNLDVAPSYGQFRMAIPLVSPRGKMDIAPYTEAYKTSTPTKQDSTAVILNLDNIDDILADILADDTLGEDLWDSET